LSESLLAGTRRRDEWNSGSGLCYERHAALVRGA
jgi:hypothetical protein